MFRVFYLIIDSNYSKLTLFMFLIVLFQISLDFNPENLNLDLSINTDFDGFESTPLTSAYTDNGFNSPFVRDDDKRDDKRKTMSYSAYVSGKAEVAKRRNIIERLEKARDAGIIAFSLPQLRELTLTQLSMFLRKIFKHQGLRDFCSDEVLKAVFDDLDEKAAKEESEDEDKMPQWVKDLMVPVDSGDETDVEEGVKEKAGYDLVKVEDQEELSVS